MRDRRERGRTTLLRTVPSARRGNFNRHQSSSFRCLFDGCWFASRACPLVGRQRRYEAEFLDTVAAVLGHVDVSRLIRNDGIRSIELAIAFTEFPPLGQESPLRVKHLETLVPPFRDVDTP